MVNASLNWASILGIALVITWIPNLALSIKSISRVSSSSSYYIFKLINLLGLITVPTISGAILFFQGWRLDPILQFGQFLLVGHLINTQIWLVLSEEFESRRGRLQSDEIKPTEKAKSKTNAEKQYDEILSELATLEIWKNKDLITEEEFEAKKKKLLDL